MAQTEGWFGRAGMRLLGAYAKTRRKRLPWRGTLRNPRVFQESAS